MERHWLYPDGKRHVSMTTTHGIGDHSRKKDELLLEPPQSEYGHNGTAQDDTSFVSYHSAADTSLNSSRSKYDGANASFISCVSRNDPEIGPFAKSEYVSGNTQLAQCQSKYHDAESLNEAHNISADGSQALTDIKREHDQPSGCCDISVYDNVAMYDNPARVLLLRVESQRSVKGDNARCLAPRRRQSGLFTTCYALEPWLECLHCSHFVQQTLVMTRRNVHTKIDDISIFV